MTCIVCAILTDNCNQMAGDPNPRTMCVWQCAIYAGGKHTSREQEKAGHGLLANTLIAFHSLPPLISLGFWGNALFNPPYVAEVYTRYSAEFGAHSTRRRREKKAYIYTVEWCNLHEIQVNRERKPSGAVD